MLIRKVQKILVVLTLFGQLCCQGWYFSWYTEYPAYLLCLLALTALTAFVLLYQNNGTIQNKNGLVPIAVFLVLDV